MSDADGYEIQYGLKKSFSGAKKKTVSDPGASKAVLKPLKRWKKYYVRVRSFRYVDDQWVYSAWSPAKSAKTK